MCLVVWMDEISKPHHSWDTDTCTISVIKLFNLCKCTYLPQLTQEVEVCIVFCKFKYDLQSIFCHCDAVCDDLSYQTNTSSHSLHTSANNVCRVCFISDSVHQLTLRHIRHFGKYDWHSSWFIKIMIMRVYFPKNYSSMNMLHAWKTHK